VLATDRNQKSLSCFTLMCITYTPMNNILFLSLGRNIIDDFNL